ncbi:hypothetical protein E2C01_023838 [Portunus trituberculatus]|uniref:Uncharacterized protein n=1 Tax=Portunus trituberculatus TaxID=210409 RepID=A0A5B7E911_PORTR|nr:hypothetical protein [Portunus trituberculatus]
MPSSGAYSHHEFSKATEMTGRVFKSVSPEPPPGDYTATARKACRVGCVSGTLDTNGHGCYAGTTGTMTQTATLPWNTNRLETGTAALLVLEHFWMLVGCSCTATGWNNAG